MLTQQQVKLVKSISKKLSQGHHISEIENQNFIQKMQQQNPFTQLQDYFNDQIQSFVLKARTTREKRDAITKQLDCIQEQLKDSIDIMKEEYELLICEILIPKKNHQNPDQSHYETQSQLQKAETSQEKREITSVQPIFSNEEIKFSINSLLTEQENVNRCLAKAWYQLYLVDEYEEKKIGMHNMKGMLEEIIKNKNYPNQHVKKLLTFPKIEALNAMHSKKTLLRGIKIQNLLIQQINKLYDVGLASVINILRSYKNSKKSLQSHFTYEVEKGFSRIQVKDHHQVFKLAILELDNQNVPQRQSILLEELTEHYQKKELLSIFKDQLTSKSKILKKDKAYLISNYQKTRLTAQKSNILNNSKQNKLNLMIYSAILLVIENQLIQCLDKYFDSKQQSRSFEIIGSRIYRILLAFKDFKIFQDIMVKMQIAEDTAYIENAQIDPNLNNNNNKYTINNYSQIYKNIKKFLIQDTQKRKDFPEFANQNSQQKFQYPKSQQSFGIQLQEQEKLIIIQKAIHQDIILEKENFNCIKIKLLGGSEKQKIQACQLDDEQIQWNQNQNEDINSIRIEIEDKLLIEQIQNCISLFEHMQIQSDKKIEKSQQNENQQFYENKNQNQNQFKELINKKDNSKQKISEQDLTFRKGVNMDPKRDKVQKEVNIESSQNKNQNQNENQQFNENEEQNQNYNYNQFKELLTKTDNKKQKISVQDLNLIMGVTMVGEQANVYEIGDIESIQNENEILLISKVDKSKQIIKVEEYKFLSSIFKLGDYIISGGEADIFVNREENVAFRVIKIKNNKTLQRNLSELNNIKQFKEVEYVLDLQTSHLIENKFNKQKYIIHAITAKINKDITTKILDCLYEQLSNSIYVMKKEFEQLVIQKCQKLIAKINQQNPQIQNRDHSDYRAQSQVLKFETSLENNDIASISLNYTNEKLKHGIDTMLKEHDNTIGYLTKVWFYHYQTDEFETKKIGMDKIKILTKKKA
ncbi:hypothetical protein ABPG74_006755 [Tetrahymena malaccensis]